MTMRKGERPPNYGRRFPSELLTPAEIGALLDAARAPGTNGPAVPVRDYALVVLLWRAGLRSGEALAAMPADLDLRGRTLRVRKSKTPAGLRTVGLDPQTCAALRDWLAVRAELPIADPERAPLFCSVRGGKLGPPGRPIYPSAWRDAIKAIARRAGIAKRVSSHVLRHQFAAEAIREGVPLPVLSRMLGHADSQITHRYLRGSLGAAEAIEAMQGRRWQAAGQNPTGAAVEDAQALSGALPAPDALAYFQAIATGKPVTPEEARDIAERVAAALLSELSDLIGAENDHHTTERSR